MQKLSGEEVRWNLSKTPAEPDEPGIEIQQRAPEISFSSLHIRGAEAGEPQERQSKPMSAGCGNDRILSLKSRLGYASKLWMLGLELSDNCRFVDPFPDVEIFNPADVDYPITIPAR